MDEQLEFLQLGQDSFIEFNYDPIAIALIRNEGRDYLADLKDIDGAMGTEEIIANGDYLERAEEIRKFYKQKLFLGTFTKEFRMTTYRRHLQQALERESKHLVHFTEVGMLTKLPEFYIQDIVKKEIQDLCDTSTPFTMTIYDKQHKVEYLRSTTTRYGPEIKYNHWFKTEDGKAVQFTLEYRNPLIDLFDYYLRQTKTFYLVGDLFCCADDDFYYYKHSGKIGIPD